MTTLLARLRARRARLRSLTPIEQRLLAWRRLAAMLGVTIIVLAGADLYDRVEDREAIDKLTVIAEGNEETLRLIRNATSPEAQEQQAEVLASLIRTIDCNNRDALQDTIDVLVDAGVLEPSSVVILDETCRQFLAAQTTTTGTP